MLLTPTTTPQPIDEIFNDNFTAELWECQSDDSGSYVISLRHRCGETYDWKTIGRYSEQDLNRLLSVVSRMVECVRTIRASDEKNGAPTNGMGDLDTQPSFIFKAFRKGAVNTYIHQHGDGDAAVHTISFRDTESWAHGKRFMGFSLWDLAEAANIACNIVMYREGMLSMADYAKATQDVKIWPIEHDNLEKPIDEVPSE